jgi:pimeloyl-ACP methyl ester carboxylesterase
VEYVGDVAIYVSSFKVSRFEETRTKIQETVFSIVRQIYSSRTASADTYDRVVLVGHSLGSVIAYDALNAAISWDLAEQDDKMGVVRRTHRLITFGSPLDKTAFLFRTQVSGPRFLREALAAQKQPLILSYPDFRPKRAFRWVNIYSRADIISGRLAYYRGPARVDSASGSHPILERQRAPRAAVRGH